VREDQNRDVVRPALPIALGVVFAVVMTWPLVLHLGSQVGQDLGDPLFDAWQIAWVGYAALHQPLHLFQSNRFWPEPDSLAFNDVMLGYGPAGIVSSHSLQSAVVVHNLVFIFAYALAFVGAYLLASELGACRIAAMVAGAAFAYAPFRLAQNGHLGVISSGGIALALFFLIRGYRRGRGGLVFAGWLVAAWQITLGFTLGVQLAYLLLVLAAVTALLWVQRGRPAVPTRVIGATVAGVCVLGLVTALQAQPYFRVIDNHPEAKRTPALVALYSPPPKAFLAAPAQSLLWAGPTKGVRESLRAPIEQSLFPGAAVIVLALLGLASSAYPALLRLWLAAGIAICGVLSLGLPDFEDPERGFTPYRLLYDHAPGWDGFRTPGRLNTLTSLGLALLAAAGATLLLRWMRSRAVFRTTSARSAAAVVSGGVLTGIVLLEGFGPIPHLRVPEIPAGQLGAPAPQLHLPSDDLIDLWYGYWSIAGFPEIANGTGSFTPTRLQQIRQDALRFPDTNSVAALREIGIRTVILHPDLAAGTPWQNTAARPIDGLPLVREDKDGVVLYHLAP
jgi:hypothetical protein